MSNIYFPFNTCEEPNNKIINFSIYSIRDFSYIFAYNTYKW